MQHTKTIKINKNYQPNIENVEDEEKLTKSVIRSIYSRFINEKNHNNMQYALEVLQEYRYAPNKYCIPQGRFIRYIDTKNHTDMKLKVGGFVLSDNGYSLTYRSSSSENIVKLSKNHCIIFVQITYNDRLRSIVGNVDNSVSS